jgi:hypothetical protein
MEILKRPRVCFVLVLVLVGTEVSSGIQALVVRISGRALGLCLLEEPAVTFEVEKFAF